jgi:hypothetical protein
MGVGRIFPAAVTILAGMIMIIKEEEEEYSRYV